MSIEIKTKKDIAKAFIRALVALIILDLTPLGVNSWFYVRWAQCGQEALSRNVA